MNQIIVKKSFEEYKNARLKSLEKKMGTAQFKKAYLTKGELKANVKCRMLDEYYYESAGAVNRYIMDIENGN